MINFLSLLEDEQDIEYLIRNKQILGIHQKRGCCTLTCIGLYYMCEANIPVFFSPLFCFPKLNCGFDGLSDLAWRPTEEVVS